MKRRKKKVARKKTTARRKTTTGKKTAKKTAKKKTAKGKKAGKTSRKAPRSTKKKTSKKKTPTSSALKRLQPELEKSLSRLLGRLQRKLDKLPRSAQLRLLELEAGGFTYTLSRLRPPPDDSLTQRQKEISRQVAQGLSNREIAERLDISSATVAAHLRTIFTKLRVKSRTALAKHALAYYG